MSALVYNNSFAMRYSVISFESFIGRSISNREIGTITLVLPTGKMVRKFTYDLVRKYFQVTGEPMLKPRISTLEEFIKQLRSSTTVEDRKIIVSDAFRLAFIEEAIGRADLNFFRRGKVQLQHTVMKRLASINFWVKRGWNFAGGFSKGFAEQYN